MNFGVKNLSIINNNIIGTSNQTGKRCPRLLPLPCDTVSFCGVKKNDFKGIDLFVVNKFRAPIEKFNNNDDFQKWCGEQIQKLKEKDLEGRQQETTIQRKALFKEWSDYVLNENDAYTNSIALLILDSILKDIKSDNDVLPPILNKGVLASVVDELSETLKKNDKANFDFNKKYRTTLQSEAIDGLEAQVDGDKTGWVVIPSYKNDPEHFEENVDRLKTLSCKTWCTATFNAEPYLRRGDFHVYLEKGRPKLGVRFDEDEIEEIQGEKNNTKIPVKYLDIAREHTKNSKLSNRTKAEFSYAEKVKSNINIIENKLKKQGVNFDTCSTSQLFDALDIKYKTDSDGHSIILDEYKQPSEDFDFEDISVSENRLFKDIKEIRKDANFRDSKVTNLGNLRSIGGDAIFRGSKVTNLGNLRRIGGNAEFKHSRITDLGKLRKIEGNANFRSFVIKNLGKLQYIGGDADFEYSKIADLGDLQYVGGNTKFRDSEIENLGNLQHIGGNAFLNDSNVKDLGNLQSIDKSVWFNNSKIKDLGNLQSIGENASFRDSEVENLGNLQSIGGDAIFSNSEIMDLNNLQSIGGDADFGDSYITDLKNLERIGGNADFGVSIVKDLGKLRYIGGIVYINSSNLKPEDFKNIEVKGRIQTQRYSGLLIL